MNDEDAKITLNLGNFLRENFKKIETSRKEDLARYDLIHEKIFVELKKIEHFTAQMELDRKTAELKINSNKNEIDILNTNFGNLKHNLFIGTITIAIALTLALGHKVLHLLEHFTGIIK